jgi:hypothetical protein
VNVGLGPWRKAKSSRQRKAIFSLRLFCGIREDRHFEDDEVIHEKQQNLLANNEKTARYKKYKLRQQRIS